MDKQLVEDYLIENAALTIHETAEGLHAAGAIWFGRSRIPRRA